MSERPDIATERLVLRRPDDRDIAEIVRSVGNLEVSGRLARVPHPYGQEDARFFLEQIVPVEWVWAMTLKGSDTLVGVVGLTPDGGTDKCELGYWLSPDHWGQGLTTEAARAVVSFGFDTLGLCAIGSSHFEDNPASGKVLRKLGFVETGRFAQTCVALGREMPSIKLQLLRPAEQT